MRDCIVMSEFRCFVCNVCFKSKMNLEKHNTNSKLHLKRVASSETSTHICDCGKKYSYRQSLHLHKKRCQINPSTQQKLEKKIENLQNQIEQLLIAQTGNNTIATTTNNIGTQNNNVHITVNAFGKENVDYITNKVCLQIVNQVFNSIHTAAHIVFFNPDHPENHNIKIPNKKEPYAMVMKDNQQWEIMDRKKAIAEMTQKSYHVVEESYGKVQNQVKQSKQVNFQKFRDQMDEQDPNLLKRVQNELEMKVLGATRRENLI